MIEQSAKYRSIILAGERPGGSALSHAFNITASVMVPVAGKPALAHVMQAITDSRLVGGGIICGPSADVVANNPGLKNLLQHRAFEWLAPDLGPTNSALAALEKLDHYPTLLTAGDHALLTGEIVDDFCTQAFSHTPDQPPDQLSVDPGSLSIDARPLPSSVNDSNYDLVMGFVPHALVHAAWPENKRTVLKFSDGHFCGSNLCAILSPEGRKALVFWRQAEADRKHPWRIARRFGPMALLRYLFRRVTFEQVLRSFSTAAGCRIGYVQLDFARAAVDVDSIEDQQLAEKIMSRTDGISQ